jgi:hypothetical protein
MAGTKMKAASTKTLLEALGGAGQSKILDLVNQLRRAGLNHELNLPQIVVCGDQSSGKSSTLEAITGIPFPHKEKLCTRFATEIILRRASTESIKCKIIAGRSRPNDMEKQKLEEFHRGIKDWMGFPGLIEETTSLMGLNDNSGTKAFSDDVLSLEICGPDQPQL